MSDHCPHCGPSWAHEHVGNLELPLLLIVRSETLHKEWFFHGTTAQCDAYMAHPNRDQIRFEELLLIHKDWDKALKALS